MPSTVIRDASYDEERHRLFVTFVTGRLYVYFDVPPEVASSFEAATSKGGFFNREIRDRYRCDEIQQSDTSAMELLPTDRR